MFHTINNILENVQWLNKSVSKVASYAFPSVTANATCNIHCWDEERWGPCYSDSVCYQTNMRKNRQTRHCCHGADCVTVCEGWKEQEWNYSCC